MALADQINAVVERAYLPGFPDNIYNSNPLFFKLNSGGNVVKLDGGRQIVQPIMYAKLTAGGNYSGFDTLNVTPNDIATEAVVDWKQKYCSIAISKLDELKNKGKHQIVDLVKAYMDGGKMKLQDLLGTGLNSDGTATNEMDGLRKAVDSATTYAGIAVADFAGWASTEDGTTASVTLAGLRDMKGKLTMGADKPDYVSTTQYVYDDYYLLLQPQQRFADKQMADGGFDNVLFEGIPMVVDSHCPSQHLFMLNTKWIKLVIHKDEDFRWTGFKEPINQNVLVGQFYWMGNLIITNRRMQGKFTALPAT